MDKIIVSNLNRSEEISSFGDRDASYIDSAVAALGKPGDIVVVEAQHRSLRDHYVKQILSQLFTAAPGVVVNRCKKDRDWMITAINQAFVKNKVADRVGQPNLSEVWICDLSGGEDFDLLKLGQTLVSQFEDSGVCVLASCSPSITHQPEFRRWSNRLDIPVWTFELPDAPAIDAFLEREAETGAINEARKLVHELRSLDREKSEKAQVLDLSYLRHVKKEDSAESIPLTAERPSSQVDIKHQFDLKEHQLKKGAEIFADELRIHEPERQSTSVSDSGKGRTTWARVRASIFAFFILATCVASVIVMFEDSVIKGVYQKARTIDLPTSKFTDFFSRSIGEEAAVTVQADPLNVDLNLDNIEGSFANLTAVMEDSIVTIEAPADLMSGSEKVSAGMDNSLENLRTFDITKTLNVDEWSEKTVIAAKASPEDNAEKPSNTVTRELQSSGEYYAQLGAFGTENGAIWWQLSRADSLPKTFVAKKSTGLWAVLSGPFRSRNLAKETFSRIGVDVFVVEGTGLIMK